MGLILELVSSGAEVSPPAARKMFGPAGGTIGRAKHSDWVLPDNKVSARHARITCENSTFYIEDTSTNGIYLNTPDNRLEPRRPYALHSGDRLLIEPYEVLVSITSDREETRMRPAPIAPGGGFPPYALDDPFGGAPLGQPLGQSLNRPDPFNAIAEPHPDDELDPLKLLGGGPSHTPSRGVTPAPPSARDLAGGSPFDAHFRAPEVHHPTPPPMAVPPAPPPAFIPDNYNPLAPETGMRPAATPDIPSPFDVAPAFEPPPAAPPAPPAPPVAAVPVPPVPEDIWEAPVPPPAPPVDIWSAPAEAAEPAPVEEPWVLPAAPPAEPLPAAGADVRPPEVVPEVKSPVVEERPAARDVHEPVAPVAVSGDLAGVLAAAGLPPGTAVTEELARQFGDILRVVVTGVMDVLRSRHQVKDEFRMRMTYFRPVDNNPLKFSVNVEDALFNLLVKRNDAYLGPVEAFEDAFEDLRNHQLAMLAGMRVAFDAMLAEFDPNRLEEQFDRQIKKGAVFAMPAKMRYWDMFRERQEELVKDPETTFRRLFAEAFTQAYEDQLKRLKDRHGRE